MQSILKVTGLNLDIPNRRLFNDLHFEIPKNALTCITGENGVGKTTLIKHLLEDLEHGHKVHTYFTIRRAQVQYVPQLRNIDDEYPLCINDFVSFGLKKRLLPWNNTQNKLKVKKILTETRLLKIANQPLGKASGGEKQRAYLAQALCADPKLLILDEATANLDQTSKHDLLKLLKTSMHKHDLTVIFITHDIELLNEYADYELHLANQTCTLQSKKGVKI